MNILYIFKLFGCQSNGKITYEIVQQLQQLNVIPQKASLHCVHGNALELKECDDAPDNFVWKCHHQYKNQHNNIEFCRVRLSIRKNTFFEESNLSLFQIVLFSYLWLKNCRLNFICELINIGEQAAVDWASLHQEIVIAYIDAEHEKIGGVNKIVEIAEFKFDIGKRYRRDSAEEQWVFGGVERGSKKCFIVPVDNRNKETLLAIISEWITPGTTVISGCWKAYDCLESQGYQDLAEKLSIQFVNKEIQLHTNTVKGMWSQAKATVPCYCKTRRFFKGYIAKYMFLKNCKAGDDEKLAVFFKCAGLLSSIIRNREITATPSYDKEEIIEEDIL